MPLFDYECDSCGFKGELLTEMGKTLINCPDCGGSGLKRKLGLFSYNKSSGNCRETSNCQSGNCSSGCPLSR